MNAQDGRAFMVSLSPKGAELVERVKAARGEWFRQMLHDWEPADAEAFQGYLERFAVSFDASKDLYGSLLLQGAAVTPSGDVLADMTSKEN
jgi:hypothetical protein